MKPFHSPVLRASTRSHKLRWFPTAPFVQRHTTTVGRMRKGQVYIVRRECIRRTRTPMSSHRDLVLQIPARRGYRVEGVWCETMYI